MITMLVTYMPIIMAAMQYLVAGCFLLRYNWAWAIIWGCYATANVALGIAGGKDV